VSLEHAQRERERWAAEKRVEGGTEWLRKLRELLVLEMPNSEEVAAATGCVLARQAAKHATTEAVKLCAKARGVEAQTYMEQMRGQDGDMADAVCLLVATELHALGAEQVEQQVIPEIVEALA
jgi:hypothetical protein